ncbi:MAG: hypothetical protein NZ518_03315 [Dehalococcoidia bacterium]|nr:hypothetical protein [Dehalococcoidia bacterium]
MSGAPRWIRRWRPTIARAALARRGAGLLLATVIVGVIGAALGRAVPPLLEEATGETDLRFQVVNVWSTITQPSLVTADEAPVNADTLPFGMNVFLEQEVDEWKLRKTFELLQAAGVRWVRQQVPWKDIEHWDKGNFETVYGNTWEKYDRIFAMAKEYGIHVLARLDSPPEWSRVDNRLHFRPPDNYDDYGDFVEQFVARYRGVITHIQIWNEPNVFPEWGWQPVNAREYTELLKIAATRARKANPEIVIVAAALAPTIGTPDGYNQNDLIFLQTMYDHGAAQYFDIMSAMGYSPWTGPGDRRTEPERVNFSRVALIREVMARNGDAHKPVWIAELGWNALPDNFGKPATHGKVTREQQAKYLVDAFQRAQNEWPWLGMIFVWHLRMVHDENRDQVMYYFGLADADFALHPAYFAYQEIATRLRTLYPGRKSESHPAFAYAGAWSYQPYPDGAQFFLRTTQPGAAVAARFKGTELALVVNHGPEAGAVKVLIDGAPAPGLPNGVLTLAAKDTTYRNVIVVATDLANDYHRLDLIVERGPVEFDGVVVRVKDTRLGEGIVTGAIALSLVVAAIWAAGGALAEAIGRRARGALLARVPAGRWRWRPDEVVPVPAELWAAVTRETPPDQRRSFVAAALVSALERRRAAPTASPDEPVAP